MSREAKRTTVLEVGDDGVALIAIVNPPVNALTADIFRSLSESYEEAMGREDVKAVVVTGAKGIFCGGFDVSGFGGQKRREEQTKPGHTSVDFFTDAVEAAKKPSVAAIDGVALGGGLELAMACHARISTPTARLGLTELQFGVIPGLGANEVHKKMLQNTVFLTGMLRQGIYGPHFIESCKTSKAVEGTEACSLGLVDAVISPNELLPTARKWALDISQGRRPWVASLYRTDRLGSLEETRQILNFARSQVKNQALNVKHPLICIDAVEEGIISDPRAGLWKEAKESQQLQKSYTTKCLVHVFFSQRGASKVPGITDRGLMPRQVNKIAILGGGLMGSGIATALILNNYSVILKELSEKYLHAAIRRVKANLESHVKKGKMTEEMLERTMSLLSGVLDYESFRNVDLVIEAVIEDVSLKQQIFAELEKYCPPYCILASNTSSIDLTIIGERTRSLDRIVGAHFFSPAHVVPLLEIVRTQHTSPQVVVDLLNVGKKMKKIPVVVGNCTGFAVNRMFFPYRQAALLLIERGTNPYRIDNVITKFGMPMGPFRLADLVGFGDAIATGMQFMENFPERTYKSILISILQEDKRAGESTNKGFYLYDQRRKATPDPDLEKYIEKARSISGVTVDHKLVNVAEDDIVEMIFFPVVNEACRILAEGITVKAADLDIAAVMGMGFPPYRGGVLFWADSLGSKHICSRLDEWSKIYGDFFKPCPYLAERAAEGIPLGSQADQANSRL